MIRGLDALRLPVPFKGGGQLPIARGRLAPINCTLARTQNPPLHPPTTSLTRRISLLATACVLACIVYLGWTTWPSLRTPTKIVETPSQHKTPAAMQSFKVVEAVGKHTGTVIFLHVGANVWAYFDSRR